MKLKVLDFLQRLESHSHFLHKIFTGCKHVSGSCGS